MSNDNNKNRQVAVKNKQRDDPYDYLFGFPFPRELSLARWDDEFQSGKFLPRCDIKENEKAISIDIELAGVPKDEIQVELTDDDILTISGEKKQEKTEDDKKKKFHRVERTYGSFKRQIQLPKGVTSENISASSKDGVLSITVAKPAPERKKSKININ